MKVVDIINLERDRKDKDKRNVVHLIRENGNWYRAHDWSAWLFKTFFVNEELQNDLRVTAKKMKDGYIDTWVGFPATSMDKYIPHDDSIEFRPIDNDMIDVAINIPDDIMDADVDDVFKAVDEWKNGFPLTEDKKGRKEDRNIENVRPKITRMSDIMASLLAFPIEEKSLIEQSEFLRDLRRQVANLF